MADHEVLPIYKKYVNGIPTPQGRRTLRLREKYLVILVFGIFGIVCFGAFLFLPDLRDRVNVDEMRRQLQQAGGDIFIPQARIGPDGVPLGRKKNLRHNKDEDMDAHKINDKSKLQGKIAADWEQQKILEVIRSNQQNELSEIDKQKLKDLIKDDKLKVVRQNEEKENMKKEEQLKEALKENKDHAGGVGAKGGEPLDEETKMRRDKVREMTKHAWDNYVKYSFGVNELRPISKVGHSTSIFGSSNLGASIIDALDTLYIMGLKDEFKKGRDWVATNLNFDQLAEVSVFEVTIRFLGGLLTAYALTGDKIFKDKSVSVAEKLLPAFNTPTGIPMTMVNLKTGSVRNHGWASGGSSILAEFGTLHLEFSYLTEVTGNPVFREKVDKIRQFLTKIEKPKGLLPIYLNPRTGRFGQNHVTMGAMGDSYYEYLIKSWVYSRKTDTVARKLYDESIQAFEDNNIIQTSKGGLKYFAEYKSGNLEHKMDHLACFSGGMLAYGAEGSPNKEKYMQLGRDITSTCHESYDRAATKLGPEAFRFQGDTEAKAVRAGEKTYILRPETFESYFYLWRLTKDQKYRDWGWEAVQALERHCRVDGGFTGIRDVYNINSPKDDVQQSWLFAETFKYLYLLFSEDDLLSLDKWVFNTEAHPIPVQGTLDHNNLGS